MYSMVFTLALEPSQPPPHIPLVLLLKAVLENELNVGSPKSIALPSDAIVT
jgi:hypothetical protein